MPGIFQLKVHYFLGFQYLYKFWNYYCTSTTVLLLVKLKVSKGFDKICAVVQWSVSLLQKSKKWNGKPIMACSWCCNVQHLGVGHGCQNEEKWVSYLVAQSTKKGNDWACTDSLVGKATTRTEKSWWCPKRSETPSCLRHHDLCTQINNANDITWHTTNRQDRREVWKDKALNHFFWWTRGDRCQ